MKKILISLFVLLLLTVGYLLYDNISFNPLSKVDFANLFRGYHGKLDLKCKKDLLGVTTRGAFFEIYVYGIEHAIVRSDYPKFDSWENNKITKGKIIGQWKHCPVDADVLKLYKSTLTDKNISKDNCFHSFKKDIINPGNFYSYLTVSDTEQYFLLYSPESNLLYYIRKGGF